MNNERLSNEISVLIDEALSMEDALCAEYSEENDVECEELHTYIKRLCMSIGMRLVDNRRRERQKKTEKMCEKQGVF